MNEEKSSLSTLRGVFAELPDASYEDFLGIKSVWESRMPDPGGKEVNRRGVVCTGHTSADA